jgi:hypothetical protein
MVTAGHCAPYNGIPTPTVVTNGARNGENGCNTSTGGCDSEPRGAFGTVWRTGVKVFGSRESADDNPVSIDVAMIPTDTLPYTYAANSNSALATLRSFPGAARTPTAGTTVCISGATSLGDCGFSMLAGVYTAIFPVGNGYFARWSTWRATSGSLQVCQGDSGGTAYSHFGGGGESILGVVSGLYGPAAGSIAGALCARNLHISFWGMARAFDPAFTPIIAS